jgi:predicted esterase
VADAGRDGARVLAQPVRQHVCAERQRGDAHAVPSGSVEGERRGSDRGAWRGLPRAVDGERGLERRPRAGRAGRRGVRAKVSSESDAGRSGSLRAAVATKQPAGDASFPGEMAVRIGPQLADANAAFALVRANASKWHVDPDRIGMIGFSAGAMLTMASTLKSGDAKPAFIANIYGPLSAVDVPADAPPLFAALAADDPLLGAPSFGLIESWRKANRPVEFHYYEQGGHGFGMYPKETTSTGWFDAYVKWLGMHGYLKPKDKNG